MGRLLQITAAFAAVIFTLFLRPEEDKLVIQQHRWTRGVGMRLVAANFPAVFTDPPSDYWDCRMWNADYLQKRLPAVQAKYKPPNANRRFQYFATGQPLQSDETFLLKFPNTVPTNPDYDEHILTSDEFFRKLVNESASHRLYASGPVGQVLPPDLVKTVSNAIDYSTNPKNPPEVNVWMGSRGTTATMHYDTSHNFYVPIEGNKRFLLMPPSAHELGLQPSLHPHYRHLRQEKSVISHVNSNAMEIVVGPGDVLFIPAFWFHEVETVDDYAIALNFWSVSDEYEIMEHAFSLPVPFDAEWDVPQMTAATVLYLKNIAIFVNAVNFATAYKDLSRRWSDFSAYDRSAGRACSDNHANFDEQVHRSFTEKAIQLANLFNRLNDTSVRIIYLNNYAEYLVGAALGTDAIPEFIYECILS